MPVIRSGYCASLECCAAGGGANEGLGWVLEELELADRGGTGGDFSTPGASSRWSRETTGRSVASTTSRSRWTCCTARASRGRGCSTTPANAVAVLRLLFLCPCWTRAAPRASPTPGRGLPPSSLPPPVIVAAPSVPVIFFCGGCAPRLPGQRRRQRGGPGGLGPRSVRGNLPWRSGDGLREGVR